jgi:DNA invertase Pin-like site-specific DNA recombinase
MDFTVLGAVAELERSLITERLKGRAMQCPRER